MKSRKETADWSITEGSNLIATVPHFVMIRTPSPYGSVHLFRFPGDDSRVDCPHQLACPSLGQVFLDSMLGLGRASSPDKDPSRISTSEAGHYPSVDNGRGIGGHGSRWRVVGL